MTRWLVVPLFVAACAGGPEHGPAVEVSAAREADGLRIRFRRLEHGTAGHRATVEADAGVIDELVHSPDLLTVSLLWRQPAGQLRCSYPYGGVGLVSAADAPDDRTVQYIFWESPGVALTGSLPRGCLMLPALPLVLELGDEARPAKLTPPGGATRRVDEARTEFVLRLARDRDGVLDGGDRLLRIETATGEQVRVLVGVDADGTPVAVSGYVRALSR